MVKIKIGTAFVTRIRRTKINGSFFAPNPALTGVIGDNYEVSASSDDGNIPANVKDANFETRWSAKFAGQYLTLALPDKYEVNSVQVAVYNGATRVQYFDLQYSLNNIDYVTIGSFATSGTTINFESFSFTMVEARYIRIVGNGNNSATSSDWNSLSGVRVNYPDAVTEVLPDDPEPPVEEPSPEDFDIFRKVDFNNHSNGAYTNTRFQSDWGTTSSLYTPNTSLIETVDGKKVFTNVYPVGTWGRGGGVNQFISMLPYLGGENITEVYCSFRVKFEAGFDWGLISKFMGFCFGPVNTSASGGAGPNIGNKGSTVRLNWAGSGKLKMYVYHHNMPGKNGDAMGQGEFGLLVAGAWDEITIRVVANTVGSINGIFQVWQGDTLVATATNIEMRTASSPNFIQEFCFHTFMGGADAQFAPDHTQKMWMDDITIWRYSSEFLSANPSVARGLTTHSSGHTLATPLT